MNVDPPQAFHLATQASALIDEVQHLAGEHVSPNARFLTLECVRSWWATRSAARGIGRGRGARRGGAEAIAGVASADMRVAGCDQDVAPRCSNGAVARCFARARAGHVLTWRAIVDAVARGAARVGVGSRVLVASQTRVREFRRVRTDARRFPLALSHEVCSRRHGVAPKLTALGG